MKKNTDKEIIVGIHAVRILLKIRPFDVYEIYSSDKKSKKFSKIFHEAKKIILWFKIFQTKRYMKSQM